MDTQPLPTPYPPYPHPPTPAPTPTGHAKDDLTIEDMGLARKERGVVCSRMGEPTHGVFAYMYASRVSAVGILNEEGDLVGNLSASDLRRIQPQHFSLLALPVGHFLSRLHSASSTVFCSTSTVCQAAAPLPRCSAAAVLESVRA